MSQPMSHRGTKGCRVLMVIETQGLRGSGIESDPVRDITEYWTLDGSWLADNDTYLGAQAKAYRDAKEAT